MGAQCNSLGDFAFSASVGNQTVSFRQVQLKLQFWQNTLGQALGSSFFTLALQASCCMWVWAQVAYTDLHNVKEMFRFRDFNSWFMTIKREFVEEINCTCADVIPLMYYIVSLSIVCISFC